MWRLERHVGPEGKSEVVATGHWRLKWRPICHGRLRVKRRRWVVDRKYLRLGKFDLGDMVRRISLLRQLWQPHAQLTRAVCDASDAWRFVALVFGHFELGSCCCGGVVVLGKGAVEDSSMECSIGGLTILLTILQYIEKRQERRSGP